MANSRSLPASNAIHNSEQRICSSLGLCHRRARTSRDYQAYPFRHLQLITPINRRPGSCVLPLPETHLENVYWEIDSILDDRYDSYTSTSYLVRWADTWISRLLLESEEFMWEVEDVLEEQIHLSTSFLLIRWKDSWESCEDLEGAREAISTFVENNYYPFDF